LGIVLVSCSGLLPQLTSNLLCVSFWVLGQRGVSIAIPLDLVRRGLSARICAAWLHKELGRFVPETIEFLRFPFALIDPDAGDRFLRPARRLPSLIAIRKQFSSCTNDYILFWKEFQ